MKEKQNQKERLAGNPELSRYSDSTLFEEVVLRLLNSYRQYHAREMLYGAFNFIIHGGQFQGIEQNSKFRIHNGIQSSAAI